MNNCSMTPEMRDDLATALARERERLHGTLATLAQAARALGESQSNAENAGGEPITEAIDLAEQELEIQMEYLEADRLTAVEAALHRLAEDVYGNCDDCGRPIGAERLQAIPWATRCIACERQVETFGGAKASALRARA